MRAALLAAALAFGVFAPTLGYDLVWDDRATVLHNRGIESLRNVPAFFTGHAFSGAEEGLREIAVIEYYRPVWVLSLAVNHAVWGKRAPGYHLSNVLLHALASALVAWLVFELAGSAAAAAVAGALFAVHPVHAEAVAWVSARNELLLGVFLLLAFVFYLRFRRGAGAAAGAASFGFFTLALLSKETAVVFPAIVLLHEWAGRRWGRDTGASAAARAPGAGTPGAAVRPVAAYGFAILLVATAAAFLVLRAFLVAPLPAHDPLATRLASAPGIVLENLRLLFVPVGLRVLHTFEPVASPFSAPALGPLAVLLAIAACLPLAFRLHRGVGLGLGWILLALVPVSGLAALLQPTPIAERYLYLPSIGWALALGSLLAALSARAPAGGTAPRGHARPAPAAGGPARAAYGAAMALVPVLAAAAIANCRPWQNDLVLASRMVVDAPDSPLANSSLGFARYRLGHWQEAANAFATSIKLRPADPWNHYYLGCCMRRLDRIEPAERWLRNALALGMRYAPVQLELGEALESQGRLEEAERECRRAIELDPGLVEAHTALGRILFQDRRYEEAERAYREALALGPADARTRTNLGVLYVTQRRWDEAALELREAIRIAPGDSTVQRAATQALSEIERLR